MQQYDIAELDQIINQWAAEIARDLPDLLREVAALAIDPIPEPDTGELDLILKDFEQWWSDQPEE